MYQALYLVKNFGWHVVDYLDCFRPSYLPAQAGCVSSSMYVDNPSELNTNRATLSFTPYEVWHVRIRIFCGVGAILAYADADAHARVNTSPYANWVHV